MTTRFCDNAKRINDLELCSYSRSLHFISVDNQIQHTGQCKRTGGCYNELVAAFFSTGGGVKGKKIYTC